jgi:hypothetical protein
VADRWGILAKMRLRLVELDIPNDTIRVGPWIPDAPLSMVGKTFDWKTPLSLSLSLSPAMDKIKSQ